MGIIPYINEYIYILYHDPIFEKILTYLYGYYINEYIYIYNVDFIDFTIKDFFPKRKSCSSSFFV
jgi:hypothetical protein